MIKIMLIIAVVITINSPFQPGDFSTGSATDKVAFIRAYPRHQKKSALIDQLENIIAFWEEFEWSKVLVNKCSSFR